MEMESESSSIEATNNVIGLLIKNSTVHARDIYVNAEPLKLINTDLPRLIDSFRGRDKEMEQLEKFFFNDKEKKVVISGLPGMGKSELAKQFADRCRNNGKVDHIFWIKAENKEELERSSTKLSIVYRDLKNEKCLFVFDNTVNRQSIFNIEPPDEENYYLLLTSQANDWYDIMSLKLNPLENNCAIEVYHIILKDLYNENYNALYVEIANIVNNIPLGLQVTAAYLRQSMLSTGQYFDLQEYVDEIKQDQDEYIDLPIPTNMPNKYEKSLYGAIQTSINRFKKETNGLALNALFICAFLNPEDITITDLLKMPNIKKFLTQKKNKENTLRKALSVIVNYSFITYNPNGIEINLHRFIQEVLRRHLLKCDKDIQLVCYSSCLEAIFNDTQGSLLEYIYFRHNIILKYSDENIDSFNSFHQENKNKLNLDDDLLYSILKGLINWNCIESLKKLLDDIKLCTYKHISHFDVLHIAAMSNNVNVMELLVSEYDIQINSCRSDVLDTPLHTAAFLWNLEAMNFLLERNADVNVKDCMNETSLVKFLLGAQYHQHFELDDVNKILNLLNCRENQHCPNECVKNLLHAAVHSFNANLVTLLATKYKFDVNARDDTYGDTPLHELISSVSSYSPRNYVIRTIKALKSRGARLDITDSQGRTPWQIAQEREDTEYLVPYLVLDYESTSEYEPVSKKLRDD